MIRFLEAASKKRQADAAIKRTIKQMNLLDDNAVALGLSRLEDARKALINAITVASGEFNITRLTSLKNEVDRITGQFRTQFEKDFANAVAKAEDLGTQMLAEPLSKVGVLVNFPALPTQMANAIATFHADQIVGLTNDMKKAISNELSLGLLSGAKREEVIKRISALLPDASNAGSIGARASRIMRTEVNRITSMATQTRLEQATKLVPGLGKYWLTSGRNVRPTHREAELNYGPKNPIPVNDTFIVGGYPALYPRDPALPPEESVNCKCRVVPAVPGDKR